MMFERNHGNVGKALACLKPNTLATIASVKAASGLTTRETIHAMQRLRERRIIKAVSRAWKGQPAEYLLVDVSEWERHTIARMRRAAKKAEKAKPRRKIVKVTRKKLSAALTVSAVLAMVERMGEIDAEGLAHWLGYSPVTCAKYLTLLERQGRLVARLETFAEADARVKQLPKVAFISRRRRRRIRYAVAESVRQEAA